MTEPLRVFFPEFETEAHRANWEGARLVAAMADLGVECSLKIDRHTRAAFVASFSTFLDARDGYRKDPHNRPVLGWKHFPGVPVIQYCWDLYPFKLETEHEESDRWREYLADLRSAAEVWVPSRSVVDRVRQYADREAAVVKCSCPSWEPPDGRVWDGGYALNVIRPYPGDPGAGHFREACERAGVSYAEVGEHGRSWDDFRRLVAGASVLVSPAREASTGGLTLLEGYRLGKPVLLPDSPLHGGRDYFEDAANYYRWGDVDDLSGKLKLIVGGGGVRPDPRYSRPWVGIVYSTAAFASRIAEGLRRVVG